MLPVPVPKLWCVVERLYRICASGTMRALRAERCAVDMALLRTRTPSRWRASRAAWRWCEVSFLEASSDGESVMVVMLGGGGGGEDGSAAVVGSAPPVFACVVDAMRDLKSALRNSARERNQIPKQNSAKEL